MIIERKEQIRYFLTFQQKTQEELAVICKHMDLQEEGSKTDLMNRIISVLTEDLDKENVHSQTIPLRIRDRSGQIVQPALAAMRQWRKMIFEANGNEKDFGILSPTGQPYSVPMKYILCSPRLAQKIIENGWVFPYNSQKALVERLRSDPEDFNVCIVQKESNGNTFVMLHVELKEVA